MGIELRPSSSLHPCQPRTHSHLPCQTAALSLQQPMLIHFCAGHTATSGESNGFSSALSLDWEDNRMLHNCGVGCKPYSTKGNTLKRSSSRKLLVWTHPQKTTDRDAAGDLPCSYMGGCRTPQGEVICMLKLRRSSLWHYNHFQLHGNYIWLPAPARIFQQSPGPVEGRERVDMNKETGTCPKGSP